MTLANIYMLESEQSFVEHQQACGELFGRSALFVFIWTGFSIFSSIGRYIDDGFMTNNLSFDQIKTKMDKADQKDRNIRIKYQIQYCVDFLYRRFLSLVRCILECLRKEQKNGRREETRKPDKEKPEAHRQRDVKVCEEHACNKEFQ